MCRFGWVNVSLASAEFGSDCQFQGRNVKTYFFLNYLSLDEKFNFIYLFIFCLFDVSRSRFICLFGYLFISTVKIEPCSFVKVWHLYSGVGVGIGWLIGYQLSVATNYRYDIAMKLFIFKWILEHIFSTSLRRETSLSGAKWQPNCETLNSKYWTAIYFGSGGEWGGSTLFVSLPLVAGGTSDMKGLAHINTTSAKKRTNIRFGATACED